MVEFFEYVEYIVVGVKEWYWVDLCFVFVYVDVVSL